MGTLLLYVLKSTVCLILFYIGFKALLSNDTFFRFNRWVLLGGMSICMLLPAIKIKTAEPLLIQQPLIHLEEMIMGERAISVVLPGAVSETMVTPAVEPAMAIDWGQVLFLVYLAGVLVCLAVTLLSFRKMFVLIRSGRQLRQGRYTLILTPDAVSPFSWGRYIILSEDDYGKYPDEILTHEKIHLKSRHSVDLLFMEVILWLHWFNPAAWLLKRELKDIHEYQADKGVLAQGIDATKYQLLLVKKAVGSSLYTLANSFNHSKIKKRITMMLKGKSNNWARLKLLLLVPVGLIVLNAFARPEVNRQLETLIQSKDKDTPPDEQQDLKEFFKTELKNYMMKVEPQARFEPDAIVAFMKKNTEPKDLFINALGDILLDNRFADYKAPEQLSARLQELLEKGKKPVSFYFLIDINTPQEATETVLRLVKEAFEKQQKAVGVDKAPFLLFEDARNNKNFPVKKTTQSSSDKGTVNPKAKQQKSDALPPPPPPHPDGTITFKYKSGKKDQGILFYARHAQRGKGLEGRIDKIYSDDISTVTITLFKKAPDSLLEGVQDILKDKIKYDVEYIIQRKESIGS